MIGPLFFYGVLMPELASGRMAELISFLDAGVPAHVAGRLWAVRDPHGHFPVMIPGEGRVVGRLHRASEAFGERELAEMDAFEGSGYLRAPIVSIVADDVEVTCEAYLWRGAISPDFVPIPHGDFSRYLQETGAAPLPG